MSYQTGTITDNTLLILEGNIYVQRFTHSNSHSFYLINSGGLKTILSLQMEASIVKNNMAGKENE